VGVRATCQLPNSICKLGKRHLTLSPTIHLIIRNQDYVIVGFVYYLLVKQKYPIHIRHQIWRTLAHSQSHYAIWIAFVRPYMVGITLSTLYI
jgi:hypothetical protein